MIFNFVPYEMKCSPCDGHGDVFVQVLGRDNNVDVDEESCLQCSTTGRLPMPFSELWGKEKVDERI